MTTPVTANAGEDELDEPSFPVQLVTDLLKAFVKAVRAHQLYMPNNPMHARAMVFKLADRLGMDPAQLGMLD